MASRTVSSYLNRQGFDICNVREGAIRDYYLCGGYSDGLQQHARSSRIRPIVYLKNNSKTSGQNENGAWVISE
ncbi:MAG: hypothetical protein HFJ27_00480 [Clostridia bacterium]|nr:hypothetical protein [Clostridia bacterium]